MTNEQMDIFARKRISALKLLLQLEEKDWIKQSYEKSIKRWEDFLKTGEITHEV